MDEKKEWHLDRRITLGLIGTVLTNTALLVWFMATLNSQVNYQARQIEGHTAQITAINAMQNGVAERLAKVEAGISYQTKILDRIEDRVTKRGQ